MCSCKLLLTDFVNDTYIQNIGCIKNIDFITDIGYI